MPNPAPGYARKPGHRVELEPLHHTVTIRLGGVDVARSSRAVCVAETGHPDRIYLPREDVADGALEPTDLSTHCPFKGDARYWTVRGGDRVEENAAWAYDRPFDEFAPLAGFVCFDRARVEEV